MMEIIDDLALQGFSIQKEFLPVNKIEELSSQLLLAYHNRELKKAGVGRGSSRLIREEIRNDYILWIDHDHPILQPFETLRKTLNQQLYLGLKEFEAHFAIYPPSGYYQKHLDQHQSSDARVVSCVLYLNQSWTDSDGGELVLYDQADSTKQVAIVTPQGGTLACFLSASIWHEVRPTKRQRLSVACWYRR